MLPGFVGEGGGDAEAAFPAGAGGEVAAVHHDAFAHPDEPVAGGAGQDADAGAVVVHLDADAPAGGLDQDAAAGGRGVLDDVGDGLLDDPVGGERDAVRQVARADVEVDADAGHGGAFDEAGQ
nr:hypothetical protein [Actinomadura physcomitrii]